MEEHSSGEIAGASEEVIRHHAQVHQSRCGCPDEGGETRICPCRQTLVILCGNGEVVYAAPLTKHLCEHFLDLVPEAR